MPPNEKEPTDTVRDKLHSLFGPRPPQKTKDGLPPKVHFSIWYFLIAFLIISSLQQYYFSRRVETIPYSRFKQQLAADNVSTLAIDPESISQGRSSSRSGWMIPAW
jgi:cell division protease FtsH